MERVSITKRKLQYLLTELETSPRNYLNIYMKYSSLPHYLDELSPEPRYGMGIDEIKELLNAKPVIQEAQKYGTGTIIFWQENGSKYIILPPFPITVNKISFGKLDTSALHETLERKYTLGVILIAWGYYAIGTFHGNELGESKVGTGYIHKEHKKGGSSQKRFARRTEEQKRDFLRKVGKRIEEKFKNHPIDYIFLGGNRLISRPLLKECSYLQLEAQKISGRNLNARHADREALNHILEEVTKSAIFTSIPTKRP